MVSNRNHGTGSRNAEQILPRDQRIYIQQGEQILKEWAAAGMSQRFPINVKRAVDLQKSLQRCSAEIYVWHGSRVQRTG